MIASLQQRVLPSLSTTCSRLQRLPKAPLNPSSRLSSTTATKFVCPNDYELLYNNKHNLHKHGLSFCAHQCAKTSQIFQDIIQDMKENNEKERTVILDLPSSICRQKVLHKWGTEGWDIQNLRNLNENCTKLAINLKDKTLNVEKLDFPIKS